MGRKYAAFKSVDQKNDAERQDAPDQLPTAPCSDATICSMHPG